jgi:outer membrane protein OmpA-like peptidoglycan-associated protein
MARYEPLPRPGLRAIGIWCVLAAAISVVSLAGSHHVHAQAQPTETQILELLKKKHLLRCPTSPSETGCGKTSISPLETDVFDVFFDPGSAALDRHARAILVALAAELNKSQNPGRTFLIGGHTDATGSEAYNQLLSERRAAAVKRFLVACCGVDRTMLATAGFGKQLPKNMADPYADDNRRVNINALSAIHQRESER